jgi:hypothetical protein
MPVSIVVIAPGHTTTGGALFDTVLGSVIVID